MKRLIPLLLLLPSISWAACDCGSVDAEAPCEGQTITVSSASTTYNWSFNSGGGNALCGQFVNGDYWVAPAAGESDVTFTALTETGANGLSIAMDTNPTLEAPGLFLYSVNNNWSGPDGNGEYTRSFRTNNSIPETMWADGVELGTGAVGTLTANQWGYSSSTVYLGFDPSGVDVRYAPFDVYSIAQEEIHQFPQSYSGTTSLVATIKNDYDVKTPYHNYSYETVVATYNVVTVLDSVPENAGSTVLRPNIGDSQKLLLTVDDFDLTRLPQSSILTGTDAAGLESIRKQWKHAVDIFTLATEAKVETGVAGNRTVRADSVVDDYAAGMAQDFNTDLMVIFSDDNTVEAKEAALYSMINYGMDMYASKFMSGVTRYLLSGAGQHQGKFVPMALFAALAVDTTYADNVKTLDANSQLDLYDSGPSELSQIWDQPNGPVLGDSIDYGGARNYWAALYKSQCYDGAKYSCNTNIGNKSQYDPHGYVDGPANAPGSEYFSIWYGPMRGLAGAMLLMPEICEAVNSQKFIDAIDRLHTSGLQASPDPCLTPDSRENDSTQQGGTCDPYTNSGCNYYGVTWGPIGAGATANCITEAESPASVAGGYNKAGRFTDGYDGDPVSPSYAVTQIESNWGAIYALNWCNPEMPTLKTFFNQTGTATFDQPTGTVNFN